jgi:hypothetical protein
MPSAEYIEAAAQAAAARLVAPPEPLEEPPALAVVAADGEDAEPEPDLVIPTTESEATKKVKRSRVGAKKLKKVAKEVKQLGVDVDVEPEGGDEA